MNNEAELLKQIETLKSDKITLELTKIDLERDIKELKEEVTSLRKNIYRQNETLKKEQLSNPNLSYEIEQLKKENETLKLDRDKSIANYNSLLLENKEQEKAKLLAGQSGLLKDTKEKEWGTVVEQLAHTIQQDVSLAFKKLEYSDIEGAKHFIKNINELTDGFMWYLKRPMNPLKAEYDSLELNSFFKSIIEDLNKGLETLRLSDGSHLESLKKFMQNKFVLNTTTEAIIFIQKTLEKPLKIIIKDILKNALRNTNEVNPLIELSINKIDDRFVIKIINNIAIEKDYEDLFNYGIETDFNIQKEAKVGIRLIRKICPCLQIKPFLKGVSEKNITITTIEIPRKIDYVPTAD